MNNDFIELLYEALDTIGTHNTKLSGLADLNRNLESRLQSAKESLAVEIERSSKDVLAQLLDKLSLNVTNEINLDSLVASNSLLLKEISNALAASLDKEIVSNVEVKVDTGVIAKELSKVIGESITTQNKIVDLMNQQSKDTKALINEVVNSNNKEVIVSMPEKPCVKSLMVNRDKSGRITTVDLEY